MVKERKVRLLNSLNFLSYLNHIRLKNSTHSIFKFFRPENAPDGMSGIEQLDKILNRINGERRVLQKLESEINILQFSPGLVEYFPFLHF